MATTASGRLQGRGWFPSEIRRWLSDRNHQALLGLIVLGGVLRFAGLGTQTFDNEEIAVARLVHPGFLDTVTSVVHLERTPPTYYVVVWCWSQLFGTDEAGLRSLSAVAGTLMIPAAYAAGGALASRRVAVVAAALVSVNPALVWYSQYARTYVLMALFVTLGFYFFARALREPTARNFGWWAATAILALACHYFAVFLVVPEMAYLIWKGSSRRAATIAALVVTAFGLAVTPLIIFQAGSREYSTGYVGHPLVLRLARAIADFWGGPPLSLRDATVVSYLQMLAILAAVVALIWALLLVVFRAPSPERVRVLVVAGIGATSLLVPAMVALVGLDYVLPRYFIAGIIPLVLLLAAGLGLRRAGASATVMTGALLVLFTAVTVANAISPTTQRRPWRQIAAAIGPTKGSRLLIVPKESRKALLYYLRAGHPRLIRGTGNFQAPAAKLSGPVRVDEIVFVRNHADATPSISGFMLAGRRRVEQFSVDYLRSASPRAVTNHLVDTWREGRSVLIDGLPSR